MDMFSLSFYVVQRRLVLRVTAAAACAMRRFLVACLGAAVLGFSSAVWDASMAAVAPVVYEKPLERITTSRHYSYGLYEPCFFFLEEGR